MDNTLCDLEERAQRATRHTPFGVNLLDVRRTVAEMLSQIGKHGIFDQYSKHDISHIKEMLSIAEWLIDSKTKAILSDADCFLIVLSIYFHDLGMLVTKKEFENRDKSSFREFCQLRLYSDKGGGDYKARIESLTTEDAERFLYQEFVRHHHARRIRHWILGNSDSELGYCKSQIDEVQRVIKNLDQSVLGDLAVVAESHHLDDLDNLDRYVPVQPYGATDPETANVLYCAVILRMSDLLHMRNDRTPSILFRLISPTDPISQREWAKQGPIRRIMPRTGLNADGIPDENASRDTIEVYAHFKDENGFFGLTTFLSYVKKEIKKCHSWIADARKYAAFKHEFPWRYLVEDKIKTEGFIPETFSFDLDQDKILDLLIGHTLYNDTSVVLRELVQNSIDATRLQAVADAGKTKGKIEIHWSSKDRILSIQDNGTGMSQEVIVRHLLKVGSSRYQDQKFRERFPDFSPISRFGIGVLSTFMIADSVEITTCSEEESEARKIALRSVHGSYLIRLMDKKADDAKDLFPHGTRFTLKIRPTANFSNVLATAKHWIVVPGCDVFVKIDNDEPVKVGYRTPRDAVTAFLNEMDLISEAGGDKYRVVEKNREGISLAYAVRWDEYYKDWSIASFPDTRAHRPSTAIPCTCVEGIAVEFTTPGFANTGVAAVVNATGKTAPKTNVARSSLEATEERNNLVSAVYEMYVEHVQDEIQRLTDNEHYSLTWAVRNATMLISPLVYEERMGAVLPGKLRESLRSLPVFIVEHKGSRHGASLTSLKDCGEFWTVDCELVRSAESLIKEVSSSASLGSIVETLGDKRLGLPEGTVLCNFDGSWFISEAVESVFEPIALHAHRELRRVDLRWQSKGETTRWLSVADILGREQHILRSRAMRNLLDMLSRLLSERRTRSSPDKLWVARGNIEFDVKDEHAGVRAYWRTFLRADIPISQLLNQLAGNIDTDEGFQDFFVTASLSHFAYASPSNEGNLAHSIRRIKMELPQLATICDQFMRAYDDSPKSTFDTSVWSRRFLDLSNY